MSPDQTQQILQQIENKSSYETKKFLALEFNQPIQTHEVVKPQRDDSVRLELTLTSEQMKKLEQVKSLLSHTLLDNSWADVITYLAEKQIQKTLGKKQPQDFHTKTADPKKSATSTPSFTTKRKRGPIRISVRRRVLERAGHCCEYVDEETQRKCQTTYQVQVDHWIPVACGGSDEETNLRALCRTHNLLAAKRWGF